MTARSRSWVGAFLVTLAPLAAFAQEGLDLRAARRTPITAASTVTTVFTVTSDRADTVRVNPRIEVPKDWTLLLGGASFDVIAGQGAMLVLSVAVPSRTPAGTYPLRVRLATGDDDRGAVDSVLVIVPPRRALDVVLTDRPGYAIAGNPFEVGFVVRNRGNTPTRMRVQARSSLGTVTHTDSVFQLGPDEARGLRVRVHTPASLATATDDVIELTTRTLDDTLRADASARVTVVPKPDRRIEEYLRVPTQVNLRAASATGVSPFEIHGRGRVIDGKSPVVSFLMRGRAGQYSPFGERDEYRVDVTSDQWRVRAGDHVFMLSPLSGSGQPGFGLGMEAERGRYAAGVHSQQFRREPVQGSETGAFVSMATTPGTRVTLNGLARAGGALPGAIGSAVVALTQPSFAADAEFARSRAASSDGAARSVRVSGRSSWMSFDAGHLVADTAFTGSQRGAHQNYASVRSSWWPDYALSLNASSYRSDLSPSTGVPYFDRFDLVGLSTTAHNVLTLELAGASRSTTTAGATQAGHQVSGRARADWPVAFGSVSFEAEIGNATEDGVVSRTFTDATLSGRTPMRNGTLGGYVGRYSGGAVTKGPAGMLSMGGDLTRRVSPRTDLTIMGYAVRQSMPAQWHTQVDLQASHQLANGSSLRLRARLLGGGSPPDANQSVAYLEYGIPLGVPVSRLRTVGRVYGRVIDAVTGTGVPNALVRLGPQVAITDASGQVAFGGVPGGEHRLSMSQETSFADAVFVGDPTLLVDSLRTQPTTFTLAIAQSARVEVDVRRFIVARTGVGGAPDSLSEQGVVPNATLVLVGERDTLYRTSNDDGEASFTDIPPGRWVLTIRGDAPAFHRFDPDRVELNLMPGDFQELSFRLVPRRRDVQVIGDGEELRPQAADPKAREAAAVRVIKPNEKQDPKDKNDSR